MSLVLLVDDQTDLLEVYTDVLEQMGHRVMAAHDGREALALARARRPDLVITDWWMDPGMDGVELCHRMHQDPDLREVPVILQSAAGDPHTREVQAFLSKSSDLSDFEALVTKVLASARARGRARGRTSSRTSSRTCSRAALERSASSSHASL